MRLSLWLIGACALIGTVTVAAQNPMRPGRWEVGMEMQMAGMQMPVLKSAQCITAEQLQKDPATGLPSGARDAERNSCKVSDYKVAGNKVTWKMTCSGAQTITGDGALTFDGDAYTGTLTLTSPQAMTMKMDGKRLGDCTK